MRIERIHDGFLKHHLEIDGLNAVVHEFHGPEGGYPHDHPWNFHSYVIKGWYKELVWHNHPEYGWISTERYRNEGSTEGYNAGHIHSIIETSPEGCFTCVTYGERVREPLFYKFNNGVMVGSRPAETRHELDALSL